MLGLLAAATLFGVPYCARVVRSAAEPVVRSGYVEAARAGGESLPWLATREVLPVLWHTVLTQLGLRFTEAMYVVTAVSFLKLSSGLDEGSWAVMVRDNISGLLLNPWAALAPAAAIVVVVVAVQQALTTLARRVAEPTELVRVA